MGNDDGSSARKVAERDVYERAAELGTCRVVVGRDESVGEMVRHNTL